MCLPPISRGPPAAAATRGKSPPSSSSSSSSGDSSNGAPPRRHRRRDSGNASTESDLPSSRVVTGSARPQQSGLRYSAPPSRKHSTRKSSRASSVVGGNVAGEVPSRRPSTRGSRDPSRLAPGSPQMGAQRSPALSAKSEKQSRSPSKRQQQQQPTPLTASQSTSRRKRLETPSIQQTPAATPRTPQVELGKKEKKKKKMTDEMGARDKVITVRAPLQGGGVVSGLMVIRPGSSRRGSESGSSRSKSSSRRSESKDRKTERPGSGFSKATTLAVGLGISLESSRTPTPTSKAKVERVREIVPRQSQIPTIAIAAPTPEKPAPQPIPRLQLEPPSPPPAPKPPVVNVSPSKVVAPPATTYPIMATLVYPTKDQLAYQPISRYQVTTNVPPPPPPPTMIRHAAPPPAARPAPVVRPPPAPPALQQYQDPFNASPASSIHGVPLRGGDSPALSSQSSIHGVPLRGGGSPSLSRQSSRSSISSVSSSSSSASGSTVSIVIEPSTPARQISYIPDTVPSPDSSTSSLVTASSSASGSTARSSNSNYFHAEPPRAPTPEVNVPEVNVPDVSVPELSTRKPSYYRYSAPPVPPKPVKAIMDSPAKRAGPWDGMPGADPNLGAYYRQAAAAKRRESAAAAAAAPSTPVKPKDPGVDTANLAAYYRQAEVQKRKLALERMKHEQSETEDETSTSEVSSNSEPWVDPNVAAYYRAAEAAKKKEETATPKVSSTSEPWVDPNVAAYYRAAEAAKKKEKAKKTLPSDIDKALIPSPAKPKVVAGRNVFFSSIRRTIPGMFHSAPHSPHVPFAPPPAPTPPPGEGAGLGEEDGPPEGAAESWFKKASMAAGPEERREEYWTSPSETTLPGAGAEEGEFPATAPPPAPTPPLAREEAPATPGYYTRSPRAGYGGYHG